MTPGRWLYAAGILACVFLQEALAAAELLALMRDAVFIASLALVWREAAGSRLVEVGWLALVAGLLAAGVNGTPLTAGMVAVGLGSLIGGYRLRFVRPADASST